jgi:N-acyl-D-aspartate/D-glutamate deacylase
LYWAAVNYAHRNLDDVAAMIQSPNVLFGLGDAGAHVRGISDASMTTSCLTMWGRDRRDDAPIPLETLVNGLTQRNALHMGWTDRGRIAVGAVGDLNVIDVERLGCAHPYLVADLPASSSRLLQKAYGYRATIKSGVVTFEDGEHTGEFPGHLLRSSGAGSAGSVT